MRPAGGRWWQDNLDRLHRSLTKVSRDGAIAFTNGDWDALMAGYVAGGTATQ